MIYTPETLVSRFWDLSADIDLDVLRARVADKGDELRYLSALLKCHTRAARNSAKFGYIGVGCITFAEGRLKLMQERFARKITRDRIKISSPWGFGGQTV